MRIKAQVEVACAIVVLTFCLWTGTALAASSPPPQLTAPSPTYNSFWEKLERLREDRQLQQLVEDDLEKSFVIRTQIQEEVDRAFGHTTTLLNVLLGVLTALPVLIAVGVWFIRRSVVNQIINETKKQVQEEVHKQLEAEVTAEFKKQTEVFQQEIEKLKAEFEDQLSQLKSLFSDTQKEKDQIIQELSQITPSLVRDSTTPETQQKIQTLTRQLEWLKSQNSQLSFTVHDYIEQGKAFYFEGRFEEAIASYDKAIQIEPDNAKAWFSRGAALAKLQKIEEAIAAYEKATQIKSDFSEAWFGKGVAFTKLQRNGEAITAYEKATSIKSDFFSAWFGKARCYALQGEVELAIESLQQAINLNPERAKEIAKTDPSFEQLRENEQFKKLIEC
ncbi:tetratricopeptide repeat protein [Phormidesmis sp. 146-35]